MESLTIICCRVDYLNVPTEIAQRLFSWRACNLSPLSSKQMELKLSQLPHRMLKKSFTQKQAFYYNLKGTALPQLQSGQSVRMKWPPETTWSDAVCKKLIGPSYYVVVSGGQTYRRNRRQLRMAPQSVSLPVVKQEADPLRSEPQWHFHPVAKPATDPLQSELQTEPLPVRKPAAEHVEAVSPPIVTRNCRIVKPPARFQKFAA